MDKIFWCKMYGGTARVAGFAFFCLPGSQVMLYDPFRYKVQFDTSSDSDPPAPKTPLIGIYSDEDSKLCSGQQV